MVALHSEFVALDRLKTRIQGLRAKTMDNGCTEAESPVGGGQGRRAARPVRPLADRCRDPSCTMRAAPLSDPAQEAHSTRRLYRRHRELLRLPRLAREEPIRQCPI